ncbi:hypothetical protein [Halorussus amylolyticus]|uniref:hypothetical protein n=1 Tax=Halorussus amylolyticus TaxID=1126242 RepID=UPI0010475DC8|nr:hypothetical protein [Halorussus amylolyticus]
MVLSTVAGGVRAVSGFLDDHWILKWFVVPIWLLGTVLLVLFVGVSSASSVESLQVVGLFVAFSFGVVALGLLTERLVARFTGIELLHRSD